MVFDRVFENLANGYNVTITEVGTFSVTAETVRTAKQMNEIRAESIRLKKIVFRASSQLLKSAKNWKFERLPKKKK
jgi:nucleoid DNA-binding protein